MNTKNKKYYEIWLYRKNKSTGELDFNYKSSELIMSNKALNNKEDVYHCIMQHLDEESRMNYIDNIIDSIISWNEMSYLEFMEWTDITVCCSR